MNKSKVTYGTSLVALSKTNIDIDNLKNKKIGIIKDTNSIEGYVISQEIIKEKNIDKNSLVQYDDFILMLNDLYDENIDAIFISSQYASTYGSIEHFGNISETTKVLITKTKVMEKQENISNNYNVRLRSFYHAYIRCSIIWWWFRRSSTSFNADNMLLTLILKP